jgi:hypothetical protein
LDQGNSSRNTRFAHVVFTKKSSLKHVLNTDDLIFSDIIRNVANKWKSYNSGSSHSSDFKSKSQLITQFRYDYGKNM